MTQIVSFTWIHGLPVFTHIHYFTFMYRITKVKYTHLSGYFSMEVCVIVCVCVYGYDLLRTERVLGVGSVGC